MEEAISHWQISNLCIPRLVKGYNLWEKFGTLCLFAVHLKLLWKLILSNNNKLKDFALIFGFQFSDDKW